MELRSWSLCLALFLLAVYTRCSAHTMLKRESSFEDYGVLGDEAGEDEAQNDDGGNEAEDNTPVATILTRPQHFELRIGSTVRMACQVNPTKGVVVEWTRNKQPFFMNSMQLNHIEKHRFSIVNGTHDLLMSDLKPSDSGSYKCQVMQSNPVEIEHTLIVLQKPKIIRFTATNSVVKEGDRLNFTCEADGSPPPEFIFSKHRPNGNGPINEEGTTISNNVVVIENVRPEHAGQYYCYVINKENSDQASLNVTVLHKPKVNVHNEIVNTMIGIEALLQCSVHGNPPPSITWLKDNVEITQSSPQFLITSNSHHSNLTVIPSGDDDFGIFTCLATNEHGHHNRSVALVQTPLIENFSVEGNKISFQIKSHQPLENVELILNDMTGEQAHTLSIPIPEKNNYLYDVVYPVEKISGKFEARIHAKNTRASSTTDPEIIELEEQPMPIQTASVYSPGSAHSNQLERTVFASTIFMYLLVRMF